MNDQKKDFSRMNDPKKDFVRVNDRIRTSPVVVINSEGVNLGPIAVSVAIKIAKESGLDLVEVSPQSKPPVCRIMDFGKFKYEQNQKLRKNKKSSKADQIKEIRFKPHTGEHDVKIKANNVSEFLQKGHRVILNLKFSRREILFKEKGFAIINAVIKQVSAYGKPVSSPNISGNQLSCMLEPIKSE